MTIRRSAMLLLTTAAVLLPTVPGDGAESGWSFRGEYRSGYGDGPLEAVFTPAGEERWEVSFHFTFSGRDRTYSGTAEGRLDEGRLHGRVETPNGSRTFTFRGEVAGGRFRGIHAELYRDREHKTGTLTFAE